METFSPEFSAKNYHCQSCNTICCKKNDWIRHLSTQKHLRKFGNEMELLKSANDFTCSCGKKYATKSGLWKHSKLCLLKENEITENNEITEITEKNEIQIVTILKEHNEFKNLILEVVKNNSDLQKQNHEFQKQILELYKTNTVIHNTNNNSHNKTFNLQFFLNEQCKDAMNIMDFVNSVTLQLSDLESVGKLGYVEGISNIIVKKLNEMDIYKRPVHCSDAKREILYVKDNNIWEKENASHSKLRRAIKYISKKNSDLLLAWSNQNPASKNIHSKQNEEYMKMIYQAMGGVGDVEENENKIIRKISKMVLIEKNKND